MIEVKLKTKGVMSKKGHGLVGELIPDNKYSKKWIKGRLFFDSKEKDLFFLHNNPKFDGSSPKTLPEWGYDYSRMLNDSFSKTQSFFYKLRLDIDSLNELVDLKEKRIIVKPLRIGDKVKVISSFDSSFIREVGIISGISEISSSENKRYIVNNQAFSEETIKSLTKEELKLYFKS